VGCEARKIPANGGVFFLDFYLYRTLPSVPHRRPDSDFWTARPGSSMDRLEVWTGSARPSKESSAKGEGLPYSPLSYEKFAELLLNFRLQMRVYDRN